jgi:hypothetical protein
VPFLRVKVSAPELYPDTSPLICEKIKLLPGSVMELNVKPPFRGTVKFVKSDEEYVVP